MQRVKKKAKENKTTLFEKLTKRAVNKILSLFPIPKIHPKLLIEKETKTIALLGENDTEEKGG